MTPAATDPELHRQRIRRRRAYIRLATLFVVLLAIGLIVTFAGVVDIRPKQLQEDLRSLGEALVRGPEDGRPVAGGDGEQPAFAEPVGRRGQKQSGRKLGYRPGPHRRPVAPPDLLAMPLAVGHEIGRVAVDEQRVDLGDVTGDGRRRALDRREVGAACVPETPS